MHAGSDLNAQTFQDKLDNTTEDPRLPAHRVPIGDSTIYSTGHAAECAQLMLGIAMYK